MLDEVKTKILAWLNEQPKSERTVEKMVSALAMEKEDLQKVLAELEKDVYVQRDQKDRYSTREQLRIYEGKLSVNRSGLGFVDLEDGTVIKISIKNQGTAMPRDIVLVQIVGEYDGGLFGRVIRIVQRAVSHFIATYLPLNGMVRLVPDDTKINALDIRAVNRPGYMVSEGLRVRCDIVQYGSPLKVKIGERIGYRDDPGVDILSVLVDHDIPTEFPADVMKEATEMEQEVSPDEWEGRRDLTNETIVTIDGDDSKDFDDAVGVVPNENGWKLTVCIADVSHYVTPGSALNEEAIKRGFSTYVTDRVVPMLPRELSNGICSLNPHVVRLTETCEMQIRKDGEIDSYEVYPSVMRSAERMTYRNVNRILNGDKLVQEQYAHLGNLFFDLRDCADAIRANRHKKGAIDFDSTESEIKLDGKGHPISIVKKEHGHAEEMIEDCMVAANVSVAKYMREHEIPCVYRIHTEPEAKRIKEFVGVSELMGHKFLIPKNDSVTPKLVQQYLESVKDTDMYPVLSMLMLRCMQKAKYDPQPLGHFGLAEKDYLHFTSPIRRYPDLIVHRMLRKYAFEGCKDEAEKAKDAQLASEYSLSSSERERATVDAEFDCDDMKKAEYMQDHIGEVYDGVISGVTSYGFYVSLDNTVEGLVHVHNLSDDFYSYVQERMEWVGRRSHKIYRIGEKVRIVVKNADKTSATVDFEIVRPKGEKSIAPAADRRGEKGWRNRRSQRR